MYDLIIIGGGPAGVAAGIYAARKKLKTLLITDSFGGQSYVSDRIENWIGDIAISGEELAKRLEDHVRAQEGIEIRMPERVRSIREASRGIFEVETESKDKLLTRSILVASGGRRKRLGVPGEAEFEGRGVVYCSTCDAPLFKNKTVAVIGGGNSGLEAVVDLFPYAKKIYLLHRRNRLKGDQVTQDLIMTRRNLVTIIYDAQILEILGDKVVTGLRYKDKNTGEVKELAVGGVFVEVGSKPNSEFMEGLVEMNERGEIIVNHKTGETSKPGIFAAGDVTDEPYKQNNISVGNAVAATLSAYHYSRQEFGEKG